MSVSNDDDEDDDDDDDVSWQLFLFIVPAIRTLVAWALIRKKDGIAAPPERVSSLLQASEQASYSTNKGMLQVQRERLKALAEKKKSIKESLEIQCACSSWVHSLVRSLARVLY